MKKKNAVWKTMNALDTSQVSAAAPRAQVGGYLDFAPPAEIADVVEGLWVHRSVPVPGHGDAPPHRVIPHYGASLVVERELKPGARDLRLLFLGPVSAPRLHPADSGREMLGLSLRPERCAALLGVDITDTWDRIEDLEALSPVVSRRIRTQLNGSSGAEEVLGVLASWLARRLADLPRRGGQDPAAQDAMIETMRRRRGDVRVDALVRDLGRTPQSMRRALRRRLGTTPKHIASLLRLEAAVERADLARRPRWAAIAADLGYADQAHLAREIKRWTGVSPTRLHAERSAEIAPT